MHRRTLIAAAMLGAGALAGCRRGSRPAVASRSVDTVFVVPGSHLDIGYTAPPLQISALRVHIIDLAIAAAERDPRFVWFEEGGWSVDAWLDRYQHDPTQLARLRALVESGRFGVGATLLSPHAAAFPRALKLLTTHLDRVQRLLGRRPTVAVLNDVPAAPEALVDALAAAGIHYLLAGPNLMLSPPLPDALVGHPFYWESATGARVLVDIEAGGYQAGLTDWGLPPQCARMVAPGRFPQDAGDDRVLELGVAAQLAHRIDTLPLSVVQDALDDGDPECATHLPDAIAEWNAGHTTVLMLATPQTYFSHLAERFGDALPVRRGEWGGDWDILRATEPVWSWRVRRALAAVDSDTPERVLLPLVTLMDHNIGLGPRWGPYLDAHDAAQHVHDVATLYQQGVTGVLGPAGAAAVPDLPAVPGGDAWPAPWRAIAGARPGAARVRVGPGFPHRNVSDSLLVAPEPVSFGADDGRLVLRTRLVRSAMAHRYGPVFRAVVELRLDASRSALALAPLDSPDARAGRWLLGAPPTTVIAPGGVRVTGPGWAVDASGPLALAWSLAGDARDSSITWLQVVAFEEADEGPARGGFIRAPFAALYPGEPDTLSFAITVSIDSSARPPAGR
jgi:Glycosyl hydrolases family 38 N-terminal domain